MGSADLCVLYGDFVDGRIYHSSLGRKEQIIPVVFAGDFAKSDNLFQTAVVWIFLCKKTLCSFKFKMLCECLCLSFGFN